MLRAAAAIHGSGVAAWLAGPIREPGSGMSYYNTDEKPHTELRLIPYPIEAVVQAELIQWQKRLRQFALKAKCGAAMTDEAASLRTARLGAAATAASQLWGLVEQTCDHSKTLELLIESHYAPTSRNHGRNTI